MVRQEVRYVGVKDRIRDPGEFVRGQFTIDIACPYCREINHLRYANYISEMKGVLLTMKVDFVCIECKFRCKIQHGDVKPV